MNQSSDDDDTVYQQLINDKGKRSRRRELESRLESGHLKAWFAFWDGISFDALCNSLDLYRQAVRTWRHSCHSACCAVDGYVKRHERRQDRHAVRRELRKLR